MSTTQQYTNQEFTRAADYIRAKTRCCPKIALILGSGLSPLAEEMTESVHVPYEQIPHFPHAGAPGHAGQLVVGAIAGTDVLVMQGRPHFYEGYSIQQITFPVRVMQLLGVETLIVTNAAGGINLDFRVGDLMLITDHINFLGMAGHNPLRGPNLDEFGPRFPSMTQPYHPKLISLAARVAKTLPVTLHQGVYAYVAGPSFETPAEIRFLRAVGSDAVGMSTVPEVVVANHCNLKVLGISSITNVAVDAFGSGQETTQEEVLAAGQVIVPRLMALLKGVLGQLESIV